MVELEFFGQCAYAKRTQKTESRIVHSLTEKNNVNKSYSIIAHQICLKLAKILNTNSRKEKIVSLFLIILQQK